MGIRLRNKTCEPTTMGLTNQPTSLFLRQRTEFTQSNGSTMGEAEKIWRADWKMIWGCRWVSDDLVGGPGPPL